MFFVKFIMTLFLAQLSFVLVCADHDEGTFASPGDSASANIYSCRPHDDATEEEAEDKDADALMQTSVHNSIRRSSHDGLHATVEHPGHAKSLSQSGVLQNSIQDHGADRAAVFQDKLDREVHGAGRDVFSQYEEGEHSSWSRSRGLLEGVQDVYNSVDGCLNRWGISYAARCIWAGLTFVFMSCAGLICACFPDRQETRRYIQF
mmetsp:Transcript_32685/g.60929  ORF Transcript_32685/g.60929 Transcript_32685/m.60929 type:complete len:205 (+) Transcript_32685:52-666(+)